MGDTIHKSFSQRSPGFMQRIKTRHITRSPCLPTQATSPPSSTTCCAFNELSSTRTARERSFTGWPHVTPSAEAMCAEGWFWCKVADRVICIYCDTICHRWTYIDDPYEVHRRLAPRCPLVRSKSSPSTKQPPATINHNFQDTLQPRHPSMSAIPRRLESFNNPCWTQTSPSPADLVQAGFFYSGSGQAVTCFYCDGSLHQWGSNDSPTIEHARWFPTCLYARHLCGDPLHYRIQAAKKQLAMKKNEIDADTLVRLVAARLDLPIVQRLRTQYRLSVIQRCIEDQLKINHDDFASDIDLAMSCLILQKQLDIIKGDASKIIVPTQNQPADSPNATTDVQLKECSVCLTEERQIACIPCGHLSACVPCGYSLKSCPVCRENIQSFVRIYS